jgi:hypothetical protein
MGDLDSREVKTLLSLATGARRRHAGDDEAAIDYLVARLSGDAALLSKVVREVAAAAVWASQRQEVWTGFELESGISELEFDWGIGDGN